MESSEGTPFARAFPMPDLLHPFSMIAEVFCFLNNESQKLVPTRNFSHLEPQKFVPANYKISPIRKIKLPQNFHATPYTHSNFEVFSAVGSSWSSHFSAKIYFFILFSFSFSTGKCCFLYLYPNCTESTELSIDNGFYSNCQNSCALIGS